MLRRSLLRTAARVAFALAVGAASPASPFTASFVASQLPAAEPPIELQLPIELHLPLAVDARDAGPRTRTVRTAGAPRFAEPGPLDAARSATVFDGVDDHLEIAADAAPRFATRDFTVALRARLDPHVTGGSADLLSCYDPQTHRGWQLSVKNHAVTSSQANRRTLHFGLAGGEEPTVWTDHGRPGAAVLVYSLAVHRGSLYAGTCEPARDAAGRVYRFDGDSRWVDCGAPSDCNSVSALAVFNGELYAGVARYRLAGSALPESENDRPGGRVYRYTGDGKWAACGQLPGVEAVGGLVVFQGRLYAGSLYKPAGFFRYEGGERWTSLETPGGKRVEALCVHRGKLWASSYDEAHIYQYDGSTWTDCGQVGDATNTQTYSFATYRGDLYVGTWRSGKVYRFDGIGRWTDCGRLGEELEVMGMLVHNGRLYAGSLPLARVYRFDGANRWIDVGQVDATPDVTYRRAWTMAEYRGRLFVGTLPSGKVWSTTSGANVTVDDELQPGWRHVAAVRSGDRLKLYVDGRLAAEATPPKLRTLDTDSAAPLRIGFGQNDYFPGALSDVRIYAGALPEDQIRRLADPRP